MKMRLALILGVALAVAGAIPATADSLVADGYTFTTVNYPTDVFTQLLGINNTGTIAGYHGSGLDAAHPNQGFTLTTSPSNNFTSENFPGSVQTQVIGINNGSTSTNFSTDGFYVDAAGTNHGFTDVGGTFTTVDNPSGTFNQLLGINDHNEAAGFYTDASGNAHAYTYQSGTFTQLSNSLLATNSTAADVNNSGEVVGFYVDAAGNTDAFLLNGASLTTLDFPGASATMAFGLNNNGQIVGQYIDASDNAHGFVYSNGVWQTIDDPFGDGPPLVNGINEMGDIVGFYTTSSTVNVGFTGVPTTTPEPASLLLFGTGLLGLGLLMKRKAASFRSC